MPQFNPWVGNVGIHGNRLEVMRKHPKQRAREHVRDMVSALAYGAGGVGTLGAIKGAQVMRDKLGNYYRGYSVTKTKRKRPTTRKKVCCRYKRGKKVCHPDECDKKKRFYRRKKYWY